MNRPQCLARWTALGWTVLGWIVLGWTAGCANKDQARPEPIKCTEDTCKTGVLPGGADSAEGGEGGEAGEGGGNAGTAGSAGFPTTRLAVEARVVTGLDFDPSAASLVSGEVQWSVVDADASVVKIPGNSSEYLDEVYRSQSGWIGATPALGELYPGLVAADLTSKREVTVPVLRRSDLELISLSVASPLVLASDTAQLVVRCVDDERGPVAGVVVGIPGAEATLYDAGDSYSDAEGATDRRGIAVGLNVSALRGFPSFASVSLRGATSQQVVVPLEAGFATMVEVVVEK